jgi:hypothetical protein
LTVITVSCGADGTVSLMAEVSLYGGDLLYCPGIRRGCRTLR